MDALSPGASQPVVASRRGPLRRLGSWYRRHVWAATALLVVILAVAGLAALQLATWGKVGDGVSVAGVSLQGLDRSAAAGVVASQVDERLGSVRLETGEAEPLVLSLQQLGISVDADATARKAYAAGRRDLPLGRSVWLPGGSTEIPQWCASTPTPTPRDSRRCVR